MGIVAPVTLFRAAYDVTWAYNPTGDWTSRNQMSVNGKRDGFTIDDLMTCARGAGLATRRARRLLQKVHDAVARWPEFAAAAGVKPDWTGQIGASHRLELGAPEVGGGRVSSRVVLEK